MLLECTTQRFEGNFNKKNKKMGHWKYLNLFQTNFKNVKRINMDGQWCDATIHTINMYNINFLVKTG